MPDLSVFYSWMLVPFIFGLRSLMINCSSSLFKMLILLIILAPISASLTRDPFSTIRILDLLWVITITIALGLHNLLTFFSSLKFKTIIFVVVISVSLIQLYLSYFVLLRYERSENYSFSYIELLKTTEQMKDNRFIIDSTRELGTGIRFAYLKKYDPLVLQKILANQIKDDYYSNFGYDEPYAIDNVETRPIVWREDVCKNQILVGDLLSISEQQVQEHHLKFLFNIKNLAGDITLKAYSTNPGRSCLNRTRE